MTNLGIRQFAKMKWVKALKLSLAISLICLGICPSSSHAQDVLNLPAPGIMVAPSVGYHPVVLRGVKINAQNPLEFDFIIDSGDTGLQREALKDEADKIIKYFLASLTTPEHDFWVNLSPFEKDRIIPEKLGFTEMGRDMLAQDYLLKQITSSFMYPEGEVGKKFWANVHKKAYEIYGTTDIPVNTFNKVWIVPEKAEILQQDNTAFVVISRLKVMLEEDYLSLQSSVGHDWKKSSMENSAKSDADRSKLSTAIIREIILPEIEKEVNEGKNFTNLRQIYNSLILATWYKMTLKQSFLNKIYVDQNKIDGVNVDDNEIKQKIYAQYLEAYQKGVYNFIKEDFDPVRQEIIPRKYFSGGLKWQVSDKALIAQTEEGLTPEGRGVWKTLQGYAADKWSNVSTRLANSKVMTAVTVAGLSLATPALAPVSVEAVTPESAKLFSFDNARHGYQPTNLQDAGRQLDISLQEMFQKYSNQYGIVAPELNLTNLSRVLQSKQGKISFSDLTDAVKKELTNRSKNVQALAEFQEELLTWFMHVLKTNSSYDKFFDLGQPIDERLRSSALIKLFVKNEKDPQGGRTYNCTSWVMGFMATAKEFGLPEDVVTMVPVYELPDGTTLPDKNNIGHVAALAVLPNATLLMFDQAYKGKIYPVIGGWYPNGKGERVKAKDLSAKVKQGLRGETLSQSGEKQEAWVLSEDLRLKYNALVQAKTIGQEPAKAIITLDGFVSSVNNLAASLPVKRHPEDLEKNVLGLKKSIADALTTARNNVQLIAQGKKEQAVVALFNLSYGNMIDIFNEGVAAFNSKNYQGAIKFFQDVDRIIKETMTDDFRNSLLAMKDIKILAADGTEKPGAGKDLISKVTVLANGVKSSIAEATNKIFIETGITISNRYNEGMRKFNSSDIQAAIAIFQEIGQLMTPEFEKGLKAVPEVVLLDDKQKEIKMSGKDFWEKNLKPIKTDSATKRSLAEQVLRQMGDKDKPPQQQPAQTGTVESPFAQYQRVKEELIGIRDKASQSFNKRDYKTAIDLYKQIEARVPQEVAKLEKPLANIQGITLTDPRSGKEEPATGKKLLDILRGLAGEAKKNRNIAESNMAADLHNNAAALHNAKVPVFNQLVARYNAAIGLLNANQLNQGLADMEGVLNELEGLEKTPGGDADLRGKIASLKDKAASIIEKKKGGLRQQKKSQRPTNSNTRLAQNSENSQVDAALVAEVAELQSIQFLLQTPDVFLSGTPSNDNWTRGGIDFNNMNIGVHGDAVDIPLPPDLQNIDFNNFTGFSPIIISIIPYSGSALPKF